MPYIKKESRKDFDVQIGDLVFALLNKERTEWTSGELNYVISSIVWKLFSSDKRYQRANDIIGVLEAVKLEFYRRQVAGYEDEKIEQNGDL